jgi:8-oxo-dGTP diphosphatase
MSHSPDTVVLAAGAVVWRRRAGGTKGALEVLVVHRPRYDDWSFPKGKADLGERVQLTAVREVEEETGQRIRLGVPLDEVGYVVNGGHKRVSYWSGRLVGSAQPFVPNDEVDEIAWVSPKAAQAMLSHDTDQRVLERFVDAAIDRSHKTRTLVVVRHGKAVQRDDFVGDDVDRPLTAQGRDQAIALRGVLDAYGVRHVVASPALRCTQTVEPYADSLGTFLELDERLGEQTTSGQVGRAVDALLDRRKPTVVCTHRPTLPLLWAALGLDGPRLSPAGVLVVHHRKGRVVALEELR